MRDHRDPDTGDAWPVSRSQAWRLADRLWLERLAEQETWGEETTGPDRLTRVFEALDFHRQSTEAAAEGHGLVLRHGGFDGFEETTTAVGHEVVAAFAGSGLSTRGDGDPGTAVLVTPLNWRKRLAGRPARRLVHAGRRPHPERSLLSPAAVCFNGPMASFRKYAATGRHDLEPFWPSRQHDDFDRVCCRATTAPAR
ncbi:hypothetical protein GCM10010424_72370 [Streptomyces lienomycini]